MKCFFHVLLLKVRDWMWRHTAWDFTHSFLLGRKILRNNFTIRWSLRL